MQTLTASLRHEHEELLPRIDMLRAVAESVDEAPVEVVRRGLDDALEFLTGHLIPHAEAEDRWLYPAVAEALRSPRATETMSRDHVEVARLTAELESLRDRVGEPVVWRSEAAAIRRVLFGLYAVVKLHFAKEEEIYLPLLEDRLTEAEADALVQAMRGAGPGSEDR
jgi:iron-sulfur cluster repair protein YtfE (RIC family)